MKGLALPEADLFDAVLFPDSEGVVFEAALLLISVLYAVIEGGVVDWADVFLIVTRRATYQKIRHPARECSIDLETVKSANDGSCWGWRV